MQKLCGIEREPDSTPEGRMAAYLDCVRTLPPSMVPSFDAKVRRKDGSLVPVTLHISVRRDHAGAISGLVAVAVDQTATLHQEQDLRESQERYRDLFENSSEMIATLSPAGRFLYANPAWKRCFGLNPGRLAGAQLLRRSLWEAAAPMWPPTSAAPFTASRWSAFRCATMLPTAASSSLSSTSASARRPAIPSPCAAFCAT